jgi:hypothetical protein
MKLSCQQPNHLSPDQQALNDQIVDLHFKGWTCRDISDSLNASGICSTKGKLFYPSLVFGIIRKALLRTERLKTLSSSKLQNLVVSGSSNKS